MKDLDIQAARATLNDGRRAAHELELTRGAFEQLRKVALDQIINSAPEQTALRERFIVTAQILDAVKESLELMVMHGDAAAILLERLTTARDN